MDDAGTWTAIPNHILDRMGELGGPAVMVVFAIARKTIGWQKEDDLISISQLEAITGLSRQGVINAIERALAIGVIARTPDKRNGYRYRLVNVVDYSEQSTTTTGQPSGLEVVNDVDQSSPPLVNDVDTQKKDSKQRKERVGDDASVAPPDPPPETRQRRKKPTDPNQAHPAVAVFYEKTSRRPNREQAHLIAEQVTDLDRWQATLTFWLRRGWSATNVGGMVSRYQQHDDQEHTNGRLGPHSQARNGVVPGTGPPASGEPAAGGAERGELRRARIDW